MNTGGNPQYSQHANGAGFEPRMESYSTTPHPGDMITPQQSMMKQQQFGMWGMSDQQQPGSNISRGMGSMWMSQQPDAVSGQQPSTGLSQQSSNFMASQLPDMNLSQQSGNFTASQLPDMNLSQQSSNFVMSQLPDMNVSYQSSNFMASQSPNMNIFQQSSNFVVSQSPNMNMSQQSSHFMASQSPNMNMPQQSSHFQAAHPPGMNMSQQSSNSMASQPPDMNMSQQSSNYVATQPPDMNMSQQSSNYEATQPPDMNMSQQSSNFMASQPPDMNMSQQSSSFMASQTPDMNMSQQSSSFMASQTPDMNMSQQSSNYMAPQHPSMDLSQTNNSMEPQEPNMSSVVKDLDNYGLNTSSSSFAMSAQDLQYSIVMQQFGNMPRQQLPSSAGNGSACMPQQGGSSQPGNSGSVYKGGNSGTGFPDAGSGSVQKHQNSSTNQQEDIPMGQQGTSSSVHLQGTGRLLHKDGGSTSGYRARKKSNMAGLSDQLDAFYASVETNITEEKLSLSSMQQSLDAHDADQQSSMVSSSTQQTSLMSSDLQQTIGQKLREISREMVTGVSTLGKGSMSQATSLSISQSVSQEADSSTPTLQLVRDAGGVKPSSKFADEDTGYCKLCNVYFTSAPMYAFHVRGLAHIQRLMAVDAGVDRDPVQTAFIVSGKNFTQTVSHGCEKLVKKGEKKKTGEEDAELTVDSYCDVCELQLNSEQILWRHMSGKRHIRAVKAMEASRALPKMIQERQDEKVRANTIEEGLSNSFENALAGLPPEEPVVGLGFVVETVVGKGELYLCELCNMRSNLNNMMDHIIGLKHRLAYLKSCDSERYAQVHKKHRKSLQSEEVRRLCMEMEQSVGRGTARYRGPPRKKPTDREVHRQLLGRDVTPPPAHLLRYREQQDQMSESEKRLAVESLKRTLLDDFHRRNIEPEMANKILESRMELLREYERRGVPFVLARERVIEEEERWNLLLEFERQSLPFEEAEQRIDHRFELMKMYEKNGLPSEEARRKVLDDEVIHDFKDEFIQLGLPREQAQKQAEKRLWMLEKLHYQGFSPEEASQKVITIERELKRSLSLMYSEERRRVNSDAQAARWMAVGEELEMFIADGCRELGLTAEQSEAQLKVARESLDKYRQQKLSPEEAKCRVLVDDLSIPGKMVEANLPAEEAEPATDPGSQADITSRVQQFLNKLNTIVQVFPDSSSGNQEAERQPEPKAVDREKQMADYDQQSRLEIQNLLSDMLKMKVPADEARRRLVALYKQHENLRESLFPTKKAPSVSAKKSKPSTSRESKSKQESLKEGQFSVKEQSSTVGQSPKAVQPSEAQSSKEAQPSEEQASKLGRTKEEPSVVLPEEGVKKKPSKEARNEGSPNKKNTSRRASRSHTSTGHKERVSRRSRSRSRGRQSSGRLRERRSRSRSRERRSPRRSREGRSRERRPQRQSRRSFSQESRGRRRSPVRINESTADDRWNASVEMFLQQYGLKRDEFNSESRKRHSGGQERYSPSDLSPRSSRSRSRSRDRSQRSSCRRRPRSRSRQRSTPRRSLGRTERRLRPRSRSGSPTWRFSFRLRSRSRYSPCREGLRRRSRSPSLRSRLRSIERELNYSPDFLRRSPPPQRFHYSTERCWSPPRRPRDRLTNRERFCASGRPGSRRSRSLERSVSPTGSDDLGSPDMNRVQTPLDGPRGLRWGKYGAGGYKPRREPAFSFEGGVWADEDESLEKCEDW